MRLYRRSVLVFGIVAILLGVAIIVRTVASGGGAVGFVVGPLFIALGGARIYIWARR